MVQAVKHGTTSITSEAELDVARGILTEVADAINAAGMALDHVESQPEPKTVRREERSPSYIR